MVRKCCDTCEHITDIHHVDKQWCLLTDEPVHWWESCGSYRRSLK